MPNTKKTSGPTPNIVRQGQTASSSYGNNPDASHGKAPSKEKARDLKP